MKIRLKADRSNPVFSRVLIPPDLNERDRRGRDSNPRFRCQNNCLAGSPIQPLSHLSVKECRGGDSNPYSLSATSTSSLRVYQFHHLGKVIIDYLFLLFYLLSSLRLFFRQLQVYPSHHLQQEVSVLFLYHLLSEPYQHPLYWLPEYKGGVK